MKTWSLIPHFYQPPSQSLILTEQIMRSCYLPFLETLLKHPEVEMSLNLSASLILQLERIQNHDFFQKIKTLVERKQIEFLNSAIFHPILPFTPPEVISRQIKESTTVIERFTGISPVSGFFPPELAINETVLKLLSQNKMDFGIVDESSINPNYDLSKIYEPAVQQFDNPQFGNLKVLISSRSLTELFRSYPTELKAENLIRFINKNFENNQNDVSLITATDVEVFGHHYSERLNLLKDLFNSNEFKFTKATTALAHKSDKINPNSITPSSWQTNHEDLKQNIPFAMWNNPKNQLQKKYQQLAEMAYKALSEVEAEESIENISHPVHSAQNHFDQGISSCHSYWLSNTPWWHPDMVELGARNLVKCIRTLPIRSEEKRQAEEFYHAFMLEVWQFHWSGKVEENYAKFNEIRTKSLNDLPKI